MAAAPASAADILAAFATSLAAVAARASVPLEVVQALAAGVGAASHPDMREAIAESGGAEAAFATALRAGVAGRLTADQDLFLSNRALLRCAHALIEAFAVGAPLAADAPLAPAPTPAPANDRMRERRLPSSHA